MMEARNLPWSVTCNLVTFRFVNDAYVTRLKVTNVSIVPELYMRVINSPGTRLP